MSSRINICAAFCDLCTRNSQDHFRLTTVSRLSVIPSLRAEFTECRPRSRGCLFATLRGACSARTTVSRLSAIPLASRIYIMSSRDHDVCRLLQQPACGATHCFRMNPLAVSAVWQPIENQFSTYLSPRKQCQGSHPSHPCARSPGLSATRGKCATAAPACNRAAKMQSRHRQGHFQ
jgi:hypothetical protein